MPNFLYDSVALPTSKTDYIPASQGTIPTTQVCNASDWNNVFQALADLRTDVKWWQGTTTAVNYTALTTDYAIYVNATGKTITLPAGAVGLTYLIKDITGNASPALVVNTTSSQNIDGAASKTIAIAYGWLAVVWDSVNSTWRSTSQNLTTAAGGSSTLAAAYANGASATDSTFLLDATRGKIIYKDNATPIGTLVEFQTSGAVTLFKFDATSLTFGANKGAATTAGTGAFDFSNATGIFSTSTGTNTLSGNVSLASGKTFVYAGGSSTFDASASSGVFKTTSGAHTFGSASWAVPANLVQTGASSATNTTAQQQTVTLVDGASSVGFAYKNATATTSAILTAWQTSGGGINGQIELDTILAGSFVVRQPNTTYLGFLDSSNNGFKIQSGVTYFRSSGADQFQVSGTDFSGVGSSTQTVGVTNSLARVTSARFSTVTQTIAAASSITINPASGGHVRITLSATAITSLTISAGVGGEVMTVEVIEDATGTRTIPTAWTNVKFISPGTYTVTTTASKRDVLTFRYDATDSFWYEQSRSMNL